MATSNSKRRELARQRPTSLVTRRLSLSPIAVALANALVSTHAFAQDANTQRVEPITITARSAPILDIDSADVGGFSTSIAKTPQSITVFGSDLLNATATKTLSGAIKLDASLADNYNAAGYIESLSIRGFNLDQASNFRRNGLATSNYAPIALENKERIEVLKGVAGLQSGVSAPGGIVNFVTKQALRDNFTALHIDGNHFGAAKAHVDANLRLGNAGVRVNLALEKLRNADDDADGSRTFASAAFALPLTTTTSLAAELEFHRKSQPSVPGLGLLDVDGDGVAETLPRITRSLQRLNLNNQTWSLPVESNTTQLSAALSHRFNTQWQGSIALAHFASKIDDRIAFPDGCSNATNYVYPGLCANGDVDVYDFRSENERRKLTSWETKLKGRLDALSATHIAQFSLAGREGSTKLPPKSAYNYAGYTNIFAPIAVAENAINESINTNADERSTEAALSLQSQWSESLQSFVGVRAVRVSRASVRSDGTQAIKLSQNVATPWVGVSFSPLRTMTVYASLSQGVEVENVPNRPVDFTNYGAALTGLKSKQFELGTKWQMQPRLLATAALFSIEKPYADDRIEADGLRTRIAGGKLARHRGIESSLAGRVNEALSIQASATYLDARYTRSLDAALVNRRVTNVPRFAASLFADYKVAAINGLSINSLAWWQSGKTATAFGNVSLPNAWQIDLGASYQTRFAQHIITTRLNIENASNRLYWREAPSTSWGGIYLFPSTPRTFKLSASLDF
jgi:iron complex outermembrane recepter protein